MYIYTLCKQLFYLYELYDTIMYSTVILIVTESFPISFSSLLCVAVNRSFSQLKFLKPVLRTFAIKKQFVEFWIFEHR